MKRLTGWRNLCCAANNILREYGFKEGLFTENASFAESVQKNEKLFYQLFRLFQLWRCFALEIRAYSTAGLISRYS